MKKSIIILGIFFLATAWSQDPTYKIAVITGGHGYDETNFNAMWDGMENVEWEVKPQATGVEFFEDVSDYDYDAIVFFNHQSPADDIFTDTHKENFLSLTEQGVGIFVLHHAVASYSYWPEFEKMAGVKYRSSRYYPDNHSTYVIPTSADITLADPEHPMVAGMEIEFTLDELELYYRMIWDTSGASTPILITDHENAEGPLALTRIYNNSRVFMFQLGQGPGIYLDPNFSMMVENGVKYIGDGRYPGCTDSTYEEYDPDARMHVQDMCVTVGVSPWSLQKSYSANRNSSWINVDVPGIFRLDFHDSRGRILKSQTQNLPGRVNYRGSAKLWVTLTPTGDSL